MQKLWLYLYFPNLQLDALLRQKNVATSNSTAYVILDQQTNQICQLNQQAYEAGIRLGMGLGTAAMLKADLQVIAYQQKVTENRLNDIAQKLYLVNSDICFFSHNGLVLGVHNMLSLYGNLSLYWQVIHRQLSQQQVSFHFATGYSPLAAKLLAMTEWDQVSDDTQKIQQAIEQTALRHTDLSRHAVEKLQRVGIHNIQDLRKIPLSDIAKRFDIEVATYLGRLTTEIPHPLAFFHPKKSFEGYIELLYDIENIQILQKPLNQLLKNLEQFLKARDLLTQDIKLILEQRDKKPIELSVHSQQGEYLATFWAALITLRLENITLSAPVFSIRLTTQSTFIRSPDKVDLFAAKQGTLSRLQLISVLQAKLGKDAVRTPQFTEDYRPEQVIQYSSPPSEASTTFKLYALRPSFLLSSPQPLQEKVFLTCGPERIDTGWWDTQPITRDYFIARNQYQQWYWVFKTPNGDWFLHGVFS